MDVVINIEPNQEEEMCNKQKPQKKRSCSIWFWLCLIIVPVAIGAGLTAFFLIPRGPDPTPQPPTTSPETPSSTTPRPIEKTTIPPIPITIMAATTVEPTGKPQRNVELLEEVPIRINNEDHWQVVLFSGQLPHSSMLRACSTIAEHKVSRAVYFNNRQEEESFDKIIHDHTNPSSASVFGNIPPYNLKKLLWTGCFYKKINGDWKLNCGKDTSEYNNFCKLDWINDLEKLKASEGNKVIYIVKDYGRDNSCWQLYDSKELTTFLFGDNHKQDNNPFLPFACISSNK